MPEHGMNSAEAEAEKILREAFDEVQAESCPQGRDCPVHFRVDEDFEEPDYEYARLITYVGDYVVVTDDSPEVALPALIVQAALGILAALPPQWVTMIAFVGEGVLGDFADRSVEERRHATRYIHTHNKWEEVRSVHQSTVSALEAGLIDVSKPWEG